MKKFIDESWLVLLMGIVFATLLAATHTSLLGKIQANKKAEINLAIQEVVPAMDPGQPPEALEVAGKTVWKCLDENGQLAGWAIKAIGGGFIDKITVVIGLTPDTETINGVKVVEHLETPGLGNKIERKEGFFFAFQFDEKPAITELKVVKGEPRAPDEIQAITGATWSSRYVTDIVNDVITNVRPALAELAGSSNGS